MKDELRTETARPIIVDEQQEDDLVMYNSTPAPLKTRNLELMIKDQLKKPKAELLPNNGNYNILMSKQQKMRSELANKFMN